MDLRKLAVFVPFLAVATTAMAVEATQYDPPAGQLSRAEVKAELRQAAANGELAARGETYGAIEWTRAPQTTVTRAEVRQELARARAAGELPVAGEAYGSFEPSQPHARAHASAGPRPQASAKTPAVKSGAIGRNFRP